MNTQYKDKKWLENKYSKEKISDSKIAMLCGVAQSTIWNWRKKFNIRSRLCKESIHLATTNHCNLSQKAIEWINGELLGDGCLISYSKYSAQFYYTSKFPGYYEYIKDILKSFSIYQMGKLYIYSHYYYYVSKRYAELLPLHKKWYSDGKKIVPKDLKLTPLTCRQWFIGDGCLYHPKDSRPYIQLYTCGFTIIDVERLVKLLNEIGFKVTRHPYNNVIYISVYSVEDFLGYLGPCPVRCYQYKWNYKREKNTK